MVAVTILLIEIITLPDAMTPNHGEMQIKTLYPSVQSSFINAYERGAKDRDQRALGCAAGHRARGDSPCYLSPQEEGGILTAAREGSMGDAVIWGNFVFGLHVIH